MTFCVMQPFNYFSVKNTNTKTNTKDYQKLKRTTQTTKVKRTKGEHKQKDKKTGYEINENFSYAEKNFCTFIFCLLQLQKNHFNPTFTITALRSLV
jgi:hypothetical protein